MAIALPGVNWFGAGTPVHGKECRFIVNGTALNFDKWRTQGASDTVPAYGFEDWDVVTANLFKRDLPGPLQLTITASGYWDASLDPNTNPPDLVEGEYLVAITVVVRRLGNRQFSIPSLLVRQVEMDGDITKRVDINITFLSQGKYLYPV